MPISKFSSKKPEWADREGAKGQNLDAGPYIGIVKNNLDPTRSGRLQVFIPDFSGSSEDDPSGWKTLAYASPFYGHTSQPTQSKPDAVATNQSSTVEHTYGMWMVPPDVGTEVLCTFVAGDQDRGYWFACVNSKLSHNMWPGMGRAVSDWSSGAEAPSSVTRNRALNSALKAGSQFLPSAEFNEQVDETWTQSWGSRAMPLHEHQAAIYLAQGLGGDPIRGAISSSSQRETPSAVFGISTPGRPMHPQTHKAADSDKESINLSVGERQGGHTFVMDDGDKNGVDQLIRLRTSGGHQILMNDSAGVLYIGNSNGTAWIEMDAAGRVMIYSGAGFSINTGGSIELSAGKNINMKAGGDINMKATNLTSASSADTNINASGNMNMVSMAVARMSGSNQAILSGNSGGSISATASGIDMAGSKCNINNGGGPIASIGFAKTPIDPTIVPTAEPFARPAGSGLAAATLAISPGGFLYSIQNSKYNVTAIKKDIKKSTDDAVTSDNPGS